MSSKIAVWIYVAVLVVAGTGVHDALAATSKTPPPIQATVEACQTNRISVRRRGGSMVVRGNTLVSPSTP